MPLPTTNPGTALGCAIIRRAVWAWKRPDTSQRERLRLVAFFNGDWFDFLFESAVEDIDRGKMFAALGIPVLERGGG